MAAMHRMNSGAATASTDLLAKRSDSRPQLLDEEHREEWRRQVHRELPAGQEHDQPPEILVLQRCLQQRQQADGLGRGRHPGLRRQGQLLAAEQPHHEAEHIEPRERHRPPTGALRRAVQGEGRRQAGDQGDDRGVDGPLGEDLAQSLLGRQVAHPGVPGATAEGGDPTVEDLQHDQQRQGRAAGPRRHGQHRHAGQRATADQAGQNGDPLAGAKLLDHQHARRLQQLHPECDGRQQADGGVRRAQMHGEGRQDHAAGHRGAGVGEAGLDDQVAQAALAVVVAQLRRR
jgi:hypothetical protein